MEPKGSQLELSDLRKDYRLNLAVNKKKVVTSNPVELKPCVFCDSDILKGNYIISENKDWDVRVMLNKFPYFHLSQGVHLLIMPISHKEKFSDFSQKELIGQMGAVQELSKKLHDDAYVQEYFINWGKLAGQSVPHLHSHLKVFKQPDMSLAERMQWNKRDQTITIQNVFDRVKEKLESENNNAASFPLSGNAFKCGCCLVKINQKIDEKNLVIGRFEHNYICLSHYPSLPGEIAVVPYDHVSAIKDLSLNVLCENMALAKLLLVIMQKYADENIRECDGCSMYIKSMGNMATDLKKSTYHLHTRIMPRTTITPTAGTFDNNSCKLDFDPLHLLEYLKQCNFKELLKS
jgi:diadenosine tetraphosphate (Ap4A) HIT family hydrolase